MTSSKEAHNGSSKNASGPSAGHAVEPAHTHHTSTQAAYDHTVWQFSKEGRDVKSYAVPDYDPYQEQARIRHLENLRDIVKKQY